MMQAMRYVIFVDIEIPTYLNLVHVLWSPNMFGGQSQRDRGLYQLLWLDAHVNYV